MKNLNIKLNALYFILFSTIACYYPFLTLYFKDRGLAYYQIGILFAANSLVAVVFQPLWGIITDKYSNKRNILFLTMLCSAGFVLMFTIADNFIFIFFSIIIFMIFQSPIIPITDAYCYEIIDINRDMQYGRIRLMGSIGYALIALLLGMIIKYTEINSIFITYTVLMLIAVLILMNIRFNTAKSSAKVKINDISQLLKSRGFIIMTISAMLACIAMGANGSYLAVLIQKTGGDASKLGLVWFIIAISELPLFLTGSRVIKKLGIVNIYILSVIFYGIRFLLNSFCSTFQAVLAVQLLETITYPLYLLTTLEYINKNVSLNIKTSALTVFAATTGGIGGLIGNIGGGLILQSKDIFFLFKILSFICLISSAAGFLLKNIKKPDLHRL